MTDHVFGGMTRPPTVAGVPQMVFGVLLIIAILAIITPVLFRLSFIWSIGGGLFGAITFMSVRIICADDPNTFEYLKVSFNFWRKAQGRTVARGVETFSASPLRKR
ncbi:VirB3 family type IV secretion system protein [Stenotrophomonas maltophilia]